MSMTYCYDCDIQVDTDFNAEHFEEHLKNYRPVKPRLCEHRQTKTFIAEDVKHPDDPSPTREWEVEVCTSCGEEIL